MEQFSRPERITMKTIWLGLMDIFNLERGLGYTLVALTVRPGHAIREYLEENRTRLVPPFRFLILTVAIGTFLTVQYFNQSDFFEQFQKGIEQGYNKNEASSIEDRSKFLEVYMARTTELYNNYFNLFILAGVPVIALATFWIFRKNMNYAEHLVVNSYLTSYLTVIYILLIPILYFTDYWMLSVLYLGLSVVYSGYLYIQLFREKIVKGIFKTLLVNFLYSIIYYILIIIFFIVIAIISIPK